MGIAIARRVLGSTSALLRAADGLAIVFRKATTDASARGTP
jgi:hypothetical protein